MRSAIQFLTIIPVPGAPNIAPGAAAAWYPLVGTLIGVLAWLAWRTPMQATAAIVLVIVITGGLHEDGLADVCDAIRAGRTRETMLRILKDSRIGAYGAIAITLSILVRWHALSLWKSPDWTQFAFVFACSRGSMVMLAALTPSISEGLGTAFRNSIPRSAPWLVALQCLTFAYFCDGWIALLVVSASIVSIRFWLLRRLGGFNGDCLGFQCQIAEAAAMVVFAWR